MRAGIIKLLTFSALSLATISFAAPVLAAPQADKDVKKTSNYDPEKSTDYIDVKEFTNLPKSAKTVIIFSSFCLCGAAVIVGTGNSIKYDK